MSQQPWSDPSLARRLAAPPVVAISLLLTSLFSVLFSVWGALVTEDSLGIFRSQVAFTSDRFTDVVGTWNVAEFIRLTASLDFIYPVLYATAIAAVWARASRSDVDRSTWPLAAAMAMIAADWLENAFHLIAIEPMITGDRCGSRNRIDLRHHQMGRHRGCPHRRCRCCLEAPVVGMAERRRSADRRSGGNRGSDRFTDDLTATGAYPTSQAADWSVN
jgi:hypothetical protein